MPAAQAFLVQRVEDGTCRTVQAHSTKSAMARFVADYHPQKGERFRVKLRGGSSEWEEYKVVR